METKRLIQIIEWAVALAACVYLVWRLATYEDYAALGESLRTMDAAQWLALVACVVLMPVNMALEAWRWQTLINIPFSEAQRQVYYSKLAGLVTPWRLGEYPARGMMEVEKEDGQRAKDVMAKVLSMGAVGSATMTAAIVVCGLVALAFRPEVLALLGGSYLYALAGIIFVLAIGLALTPKALKKWAEVNNELLIQSLVQSAVRLLCWCVQLGLVIFALSSCRHDVMTLLQLSLIYYLLVTITPNVPVVEAGVRGAWAILLFGTANAALAGVLLWVINTLLPCLAWLFLRKNTTK